MVDNQQAEDPLVPVSALHRALETLETQNEERRKRQEESQIVIMDLFERYHNDLQATLRRIDVATERQSRMAQTVIWQMHQRTLQFVNNPNLGLQHIHPDQFVQRLEGPSAWAGVDVTRPSGPEAVTKKEDKELEHKRRVDECLRNIQNFLGGDEMNKALDGVAVHLRSTGFSGFSLGCSLESQHEYMALWNKIRTHWNEIRLNVVSKARYFWHPAVYAASEALVEKHVSGLLKSFDQDIRPVYIASWAYEGRGDSVAFIDGWTSARSALDKAFLPFGSNVEWRPITVQELTMSASNWWKTPRLNAVDQELAERGIEGLDHPDVLKALSLTDDLVQCFSTDGLPQFHWRQIGHFFRDSQWTTVGRIDQDISEDKMEM